MATERTVLVRLKANPNDFVRGMATATAAVNGLRKEIDTTNDRTAWMAQSILGLGPTLIPLGAAATPVLSGIVTQMGAVASAAGVAALAFTGVGDAIKAVNDYQLDPTEENLLKLRQSMTEIGPVGADFVRFLDDVGPRFDRLQMSARDGFFPGAEAGIREFMDMLPKVNYVVHEIAEGMGQLTFEAGQGLSGEKFSEFFAFLERDAKPILLDFGRTFGNFAEGFANLLVAFVPLSNDFSKGLLGMSRDFAEWSRSLETNAAFQDFVEYVRESGPKAIDLIGSLVAALVQIVEAAAPIGDVMLPALSSLFDVIAKLADSPIGTLFIGAAAAMSIYGRAAALASITTGGLGKAVFGTSLSLKQQRVIAAQAGVSVDQLGAAYGRTASRAGMLAKRIGPMAGAAAAFGLAMTDVDEQLGVQNTLMGASIGLLAGPWGAAVGAGVGALMDFADSNDYTSDEVAQLTDTLEKQTGAITNDTREWVANKLEKEGSLELARDLGLNLDLVTDAALGNAKSLAEAKSQLDLFLTSGGAGGDQVENFANADKAYQLLEILGDTNGALAEGQEKQRRLAEAVYGTETAFGRAESAVEHFHNEVEALNAFLERRSSLRDYEAALDTFTEDLEKNGDAFGRNTEAGRANQANLDNILKTTIAVAQQLRGSARQEFLTQARADVREMREQGLLTEQQMDRLLEKFRRLDRVDVKPKVSADVSDFMRDIRDVASMLNILDGTVVEPTIRVNRSGAGGQGRGYDGYAAGGFVGDTANAHPPMIAAGAAPVRVWAEPETKGESYIPHANDWRRPRAKSILEQTASLFGGAVQWNAAGSFAPARGAASGGGGESMDYDRLANAMLRARPLYGEVTVMGDDSFRKQMLQDQQRAAMGGY